MDKDRIRILSIVKETFNLAEMPSEDATRETIKNWDSLNHFHLIMNLEKEFNIKFEMNKIPSLNSIAMIEKEIRGL